MKKRAIITKKQIEKKQQRFIKAGKNFKKAQEKIAPFIKRRRFKRYSTDEKWCEASSLLYKL